jgi:hypothetical protein
MGDPVYRLFLVKYSPTLIVPSVLRSSQQLAEVSTLSGRNLMLEVLRCRMVINALRACQTVIDLVCGATVFA